MIPGEAADAAAGTGGQRRSRASRGLLAAVTLLPAIVILALAADAGRPLLLLVAVAGFAAWTLADARATVLIAVLLATFVDYAAGTLSLEIAALGAWIAWSALLLFWRSAWRGWTPPPRELRAGVVVWLVVCAMGVAIGLLRGNPLRDLGLEVLPALWPLAALAVPQVFDRRHLGYALLGLVAIGVVHAVFGLVMLQAYRQRLGGIYFTTVTGIAAVVLWSAALAAPRKRTRALCLLAMIPMLLHLFFSFTRGYWLGAIAGFVTATLLGWRSLGRFEPRARRRRLLLVPALLLVAAVTGGIASVYFGGSGLLTAAGGRFESSFSTQATRETLSNVIRLAEYDRAIAAALRSPIVGSGFGATIVTRDPLFRTIREQWYVHEYYLLLWLKLGVIGLLGFGYLIVRFARAAWRRSVQDDGWLGRAWSVAAVAVTVQVLAILVTNYSLADLNSAGIFAYVWGVYAASAAGRGAPGAVTSSPGG